MRLSIYFRCDQEEQYTTDDYEFEADSWEKVLDEIRSIESRNTVLSVTRLDID